MKRPLLLFVFLLAGCASHPRITAKNPAGCISDEIVQIGTFGALLAGALEGAVPYGEIRQFGDFGVGTFDGLDGEMLADRGRFVQIRADGRAYPVTDSQRAPFATVKCFQPDLTAELGTQPDWQEFQKALDALIPAPNLPVAIRIRGRFRYVKTRSVARKLKPYPPLTEIIRTQPEFEHRDVEGLMAGFRFPSYLSGINLPGWHLHFLNSEEAEGGHVLEAVPLAVTVEIDTVSGLRVLFPSSGEFHEVVLGEER